MQALPCSPVLVDVQACASVERVAIADKILRETPYTELYLIVAIRYWLSERDIINTQKEKIPEYYSDKLPIAYFLENYPEFKAAYIAKNPRQ